MTQLLHSSRYGLTTALVSAMTGLLVALFREASLPWLLFLIAATCPICGLFAAMTIPFERMGDK